GALLRLAAPTAGAPPAGRRGREHGDTVTDAKALDTPAELDDLARELVTQHRAGRGGEHTVARHLEIGRANPTPTDSNHHLSRRPSPGGAPPGPGPRPRA